MKKLLLLLPLGLLAVEPPQGAVLSTNKIIYTSTAGAGTQMVFTASLGTNRWMKSECTGPETNKAFRVFGWKQVSVVNTNK